LERIKINAKKKNCPSAISADYGQQLINPKKRDGWRGLGYSSTRLYLKLLALKKCQNCLL